ncbi:hypothetical protein DL771_000941 [Monosporascus sp. 5C6A]|nr:hypothetical protein DL771_000941 [Monosporascus sp. 5C6A]
MKGARRAGSRAATTAAVPTCFSSSSSRCRTARAGRQRGGEATGEDVSWTLLDDGWYDRYLRLRVDRAAPRHYCSRPQHREVIDLETADGDGVVFCRHCGAGTCARCRQDQHRAISCDQAPDDGLNGLMRRGRWRRDK